MSITLTTVILFAVFGVLLFLGVPISISIVVSSIVTAMSTLSWDQITFITMQKMNSGVESFSLLAVPLFILAGNIMNNGGIAKRLVNFAQLFVGKIPGSMAQANILGNMLFGALSGSSVAAASAMGGCISPIEEENGYDPAYSAAANIASAPTGLLIPPTSAFIVYSTVAGGVSISTLFMAGYVPGILMGLCCMLVAFVGAKKAGMKATGYDKSKSIGKTIWDAVPSLLLIVIVIGGIVSGIFTATEGAGIAVLYCLILSIVYKSITFKSFLKILLDSAKTSGIILFLISASSAMSFVMAYSGIPAAISNGLMSLTSNKYIIFLLMNIILLVIGMCVGPNQSSFTQNGLTVVVVTMLAVLLHHVLGLVAGYAIARVFRFNEAIVLGCVSGSRTTTAALGAVEETLESNVPAMGYTITYAIGNTLLIIWGVVIVLLVA